jgi:hypothetical protein
VEHQRRHQHVAGAGGGLEVVAVPAVHRLADARLREHRLDRRPFLADEAGRPLLVDLVEPDRVGGQPRRAARVGEHPRVGGGLLLLQVGPPRCEAVGVGDRERHGAGDALGVVGAQVERDAAAPVVPHDRCAVDAVGVEDGDHVGRHVGGAVRVDRLRGQIAGQCRHEAAPAAGDEPVDERRHPDRRVGEAVEHEDRLALAGLPDGDVGPRADAARPVHSAA